MAPERFRKSLGFAAIAAAPCALLSSSPALAQTFGAAQWLNAAPVAIALGAGGFGLVAMMILRGSKRDGAAFSRRAQAQVAALRSVVDQYEALLSGAREITLMWTGTGAAPRILGQVSSLLPPGRPPEALLNFSLWLSEADAARLSRAVEDLRVDGRAFELALATRDDGPLRASGFLVGDGTALRLRPAGKTADVIARPDEVAKAMLEPLPDPGFVRDSARRLLFANPAYHMLARRIGRRSSDSEPADLVDLQHVRGSGPRTLAFGDAGTYELVEAPLGQGIVAGLLRRIVQVEKPAATASELAGSYLSGVIDAIWVPVAIFDHKRELVQANRAYAALWGLDPLWLKPGLEERAILDRLRKDGKLPSEPDYRSWLGKHLGSAYALKARRDSDPWHLPDGRTINVIAAPAGPAGGVIYVFDDMTGRLELESRHRALLEVQRSTINSLTEAVAVFGTNGRLTLSNPRLSAVWKLPMNELGNNPHIDQLADASARALPEDGKAVWRDLKRAVIDLNPSRTDRSGRITRSDGRLLDYSIVRLPDGQTMMTFLDVTESAKYSQVLKERNEALITADRLKDAFVQNVSYELRSPLTNIIGFADLLASEDVGPLNARQRAYTNYIRASSETLGVLIDNILDLATVDAGIAELRPEWLDVSALVEKARAGLAATFPAVDGETPLNLSLNVPADLPQLHADSTRIVQILYNLLSSAARFSEPGAAINLSVRARGERMIFTVEDDGTEMSEEFRASILQRGTDPALGARSRGAGLGLSIVRAFVSLHGGTISIEKREPRGNRVVVSLPLRMSTATAGAAE